MWARRRRSTASGQGGSLQGSGRRRRRKRQYAGKRTPCCGSRRMGSGPCFLRLCGSGRRRVEDDQGIGPLCSRSSRRSAKSSRLAGFPFNALTLGLPRWTAAVRGAIGRRRSPAPLRGRVKERSRQTSEALLPRHSAIRRHLNDRQSRWHTCRLTPPEGTIASKTSTHSIAPLIRRTVWAGREEI